AVEHRGECAASEPADGDRLDLVPVPVADGPRGGGRGAVDGRQLRHVGIRQGVGEHDGERPAVRPDHKDVPGQTGDRAEAGEHVGGGRRGAGGERQGRARDAGEHRDERAAGGPADRERLDVVAQPIGTGGRGGRGRARDVVGELRQVRVGELVGEHDGEDGAAGGPGYHYVPGQAGGGVEARPDLRRGPGGGE